MPKKSNDDSSQSPLAENVPKNNSSKIKESKDKQSSKSKSLNKKTNSRKSSEQSKNSKADKHKSVSSVEELSDTVVIPSSVTTKIHKIESLPGAVMVRNESAINTAGYFIERVKISSTESSQILRARRLKNAGKKVKSKSSATSNSETMVVKVTNLTECSPRFRANLLKKSVRIMRFIGTLKRNPSTSVFIKIFEIFQMDSVKLYVFMEECRPSPTLYDLVKSQNPISAEDIRNYFKIITSGVDALQKMGVAHRYLKLQHILFDQNNQPKLCGWSKAVFSYELDAKRILLQNVERRVRRNYFLPPEAFCKPYDPSKADIWSLGVMLVAMSTKRYPFNVRDEKTKFSTQWRDFVKKHEMNLHVRALCNKIFTIDPKHRIPCEKILADPYFKVAKAKLLPLSIKADSEMVDRESSRVGALSAIDFNSSSSKTNEGATGVMEEAQDAAGTEVQDGGAVGEEENLSPAEAYDESQLAENTAPEETECKADEIPEEAGE